MRYILIAIMLFSTNTLFAQKKTSAAVIKYKEFDYLQDTNVIYSDKERMNSKVGIKIKNVNKRLVNINKEVQSTTYNETAPPLFETFSKAKLPDPPTQAAGLAEGSLVLLSNDDIQNANIPDSIRIKINALQGLYSATGRKMIDLNNAITDFASNYTNMKAVLQYHSDLLLLQDLCNTSFSDVLNSVNTLTKTTFSANTSVSQADRGLLLQRSDYVQNKGIINRFVTKIVDAARSSHNDIVATQLPSKLEETAKHLESIKQQVKSLTTSLGKISKPNNATKNLISRLKQEQSNFLLEKELKDINYNLSKVDLTKLLRDVEEFATTGRKSLFATYDHFNESNYTYYVSPQPIDKDLTVISLNIEPKENVPCSPIPRAYELRIRPKGGIKIDFSTGLFINFGGNDFRDQSYRYDSVPGQPDQQCIIRNKSKNAIFPSVGALMHIYPRNGKEFQVGGNFGISTKDLERINYHLGMSFIFGYSRRFVLNAGGTLTKATLIADKYEVGQIINKQNAPADIPTSTFNRIGFFLALTYNL
ncbi:MAG: hypothetical protein EOP48_01875 [Sphingobacteriales bacterium]|nr:MAG: hypothetical protein EOP48_01875 [Sphingobacteriales bacterium]